ncbi:MAG: YkgJ family cysteine cluster protein [Candidatus Melainabacteria bacterium]|nr:YkgJ family cysteine cluster protein [Candidatus Melainabacteria bacterium]
MNSLFETVLYIPEGINFDCTGCGNCCFHWPVPATDQDVERIRALVGDADPPNFRKLPGSVDKMKAFTHALEKKADGSCQYLDADLRCRLHKNFGIESKPAMCQLFPYTFTITPTGAYASLSFASTGVLLNSGAPLTAQKEFLQNQLALFIKLFPNEPDWSKIQLVDGVPLRWVEFLLIDKILLENIQPANPKSLNRENLLSQSKMIISKLPKPVDLDNAHLTKVRPILIDQILIKLLYELYFVDDPYREDAAQFDQKQFLDLLAAQPQSLSLQFSARKGAVEQVSFKSINDCRVNAKDNIELEKLLTRMVYCRLFSKLYFGPGFGGLSLLSGFHHLVVLVALVRIHLKLASITGLNSSDFNWQLEQIRMIERRLTVTSLSREAHAILEVLLQSPARIERILSLSA